jgi:hypothetical protein
MNDEMLYEKLKEAVVEYDSAQKALEDHNATWGAWYQRDEPVTSADKRADNKIYNVEREITRRLKSATVELIIAARRMTE